MRDERVFYRQVEKGWFKATSFDDLKADDIFIIVDYPTGTGHEDGKRLFKMIGEAYENENGIGTLNVDFVGFIDDAVLIE